MGYQGQKTGIRILVKYVEGGDGVMEVEVGVYAIAISGTQQLILSGKKYMK